MNIATLLTVFTLATGGEQKDTLVQQQMDEVVVSSFYRTSGSKGGEIERKTLQVKNYGQEPSHLLSTMPGTFSLNDNGTEYGYGYFRIRGLDQTRINVTLDGCPWNEAEDFGAYFANSPDLMSSMSSIRMDRGTASSLNGIAGVAGGIMLESVNLRRDTTSYLSLGAGSFGSYKVSGVYNMGERRGWGLHVKATHQHTDGYRDYGFNTSEALTVKTGRRFNERHSIDFLTMNGYHRNGQGWIGNTKAELQVNPHANGNNQAEDDNWLMSMNRFQYKGWLADHLLMTASAYLQYQDGAYRMDLDNYMRRMVDRDWSDTGILYDYGLTHWMLGMNAAVKAYLGNTTLTTGVNGYRFERRHFMADKGVNVPMEEYYDNRGRKNDLSAFASVQHRIGRQLSVFGNVQYRHDSFLYRDKKDVSLSFGSADMGAQWDFANYGFGMEWRPSKSWNVFAKFNEVHREPTRSDMFGGNETFTGELATLRSERARDLEVGVVFNPSSRLSIAANLYRMWFSGELVLNGEYGLNGLPCHDNAEESYRQGAEVSMIWNIVSRLHLTGSASLSQNRVTTATFGKRTHVLSPSGIVHADLAWKADRFSLGLTTDYRSRMFVDMENRHEVPMLFSIGAYASIRTESVEWSLRASNLTNRTNYCTGAVGVNNETLFVRNACTAVNFGMMWVF